MHDAGPSRQSMLQLFLLLSGAAFAPAEGSCVPRALLSIDVAKLRTAAHRLFVVNGSVDTMAYSDMPSVDTIDRQLTIAFDLPELNLPADTANALNETCGRSWRCGCLEYEVCPGMELTTAMTRDFAAATNTNGGPPNLTVRTLNESACNHFMQTVRPCMLCTTDARVRLGRDHGQEVLVVVH
jgi:hypothetical protein